jgi:hypothetical protein
MPESHRLIVPLLRGTIKAVKLIPYNIQTILDISPSPSSQGVCMKSPFFISLLGMLFLSFSVPAQTDSASSEAPATKVVKDCKLDSIVFATGIESRAPVGPAKEFEPSVRKIFCWTKLSISAAPVTVKHVWYNGTEKVLEVPLRLRYASGRLWSYKTVTPGDWKVDVVNEAGDVIGTASFTAK